MKNLKVKLKILLSFGIVILLILALSIFVVFSNLSTNNMAQMMRNEMQMQALGTKLVDQFSQANAGINIINYSFDAQEYDSVLSNISGCVQTLGEMQSYIDSDPDLLFLQSDVDLVAANGDAWSGNINGILSLNQELRSTVEETQRDRLTLAEQSMGIFDYQIELSIDEASQDIDETARLRRVSRVEQGADIGARLNEIGNAFEIMFESLDISHIDEEMAFFEETFDVLTQFHDESALQYNIETSAAMLATLDAYRDNINAFLSILSERDSLIQNGKDLSANALRAVGALVASLEASALNNADTTIHTTSLALIIAIAIVIVGIVISIFLALYLSSHISNPLSLLTAFMQKASDTGDITLSQADGDVINQYAQVKDDIGLCIGSCASFVGRITEVSKTLEVVANSDLTAELAPLSNQDTIGLSLQKMTGNLNNMFYEINSATTQVSAGAKQVADGAQSLAQGSTEQAASIEELSNSISEIARKTKTNAEIADKATKLADKIKENAEKGSCQMDEMISAVKSIDQSSQEINKVIKVIDDIAFQTNILALNAAVEAARAGQHGKGFAVVAEEVRNLASKSAEAAKDTGSMIQASVEKAELGVRIAEETAASLSEIVTGVKDSSELIREIAKASEEQSAGTTQINTGIDQVAQVVQMNSATAEESAAASEEMSSQSNLLQELISRFKLKDGGSTRQGSLSRLSQTVRPTPKPLEEQYDAQDPTKYDYQISS